MPERAPLTDEDLRHYLNIEGFDAERIARMYGLTVSKVERQMARLDQERQREEARQQRLLRRAMSGRPAPPDWIVEAQYAEDLACPPLAPARDLQEWARATFVDEEGLLCNVHHAHLRFGTIGVVWSGLGLTKQMRPVAGQMAIPQSQGDKWARARHDWLMHHWFGCVPDFLMTLSAAVCAQADDASFCALVEHELYHGGQAKDIWGAPKWNDFGPVFALRAHGAEEHPEIVERYGVGAAAAGVAELVQAASRPPTIALATIAQACGTCL